MNLKKKPAAVKPIEHRLKLSPDEDAILRQIQTNCRQAGLTIKKSQILRLGLELTAQLDPERLRELLDGLKK